MVRIWSLLKEKVIFLFSFNLIIYRFQNRRTKWKKQNPGLDVNSPTIPTSVSSSTVGMHSAAAAAYAACAASFYNSQQQQVNGSSSSNSSNANAYPLLPPLYAASLYANARKFTWPTWHKTYTYMYYLSSFCSRLYFFFCCLFVFFCSSSIFLFSIQLIHWSYATDINKYKQRKKNYWWRVSCLTRICENSGDTD